MINKIIFTGFAIVLLFFAVFYVFHMNKAPAVLSEKESLEEFTQSVTHADMEQVFQEMLNDKSLALFLKENPIYIIENEFIDQTYKIDHQLNPAIIISQENFDKIKEQKNTVGYLKITKITYQGGWKLTRGKNAISVDYCTSWPHGDGDRGFMTFIKENGRWINVGGFSVS